MQMIKKQLTNVTTTETGEPPPQDSAATLLRTNHNSRPHKTTNYFNHTVCKTAVFRSLIELLNGYFSLVVGIPCLLMKLSIEQE